MIIYTTKRRKDMEERETVITYSTTGDRDG